MDNPKTKQSLLVYGWAAQLPEPLKTKCENDILGKLFKGELFFNNMIDAVSCIAKELDSDFYRGVWHYLLWNETPHDKVSKEYKDGFREALAAFMPPRNHYQNNLPQNQPVAENKSDKMETFQWEDIAHHYTGSGIIIEYKNLREQPIVFFHGGQTWDGDRIWRPSGTYTPILRHRFDMTEAESIELYNFVFQFDDVETNGKICRGWVKNHFAAGKFTPHVLHWLISKGFDMFGIIESGKAIRKEA